MRCDDVTRRLSGSNEPAEASLVAHLATCPRCAVWAKQCARLDHVWDATRMQPPADSFGRVWSRVEHSLVNHRKGSDVLGRVAFLRQPRTWIAGLAAAAALLLTWAALTGPFRSTPQQNDANALAGVGSGNVQVELAQFEAQPGETLIIHIGERQSYTQSQPSASLSENENIAADFDLFNHMESLGAL